MKTEKIKTAQAQRSKDSVIGKYLRQNKPDLYTSLHYEMVMNEYQATYEKALAAGIVPVPPQSVYDAIQQLKG